MATKCTLKSTPETSFRAGCRNRAEPPRARPGKVVVDAGDTEIGFPAERLAQVMRLVREGAEELDDGEDEKCLVVWYDPERASTPEKSARSALRGDQ